MSEGHSYSLPITLNCDSSQFTEEELLLVLPSEHHTPLKVVLGVCLCGELREECLKDSCLFSYHVFIDVLPSWPALDSEDSEEEDRRLIKVPRAHGEVKSHR